MRARAPKKKKAPGEVRKTASRQSPAAEPPQPTADASPQPTAAAPPGEASARRVIPDAQGPPVVAPVLMPAVMLSDREGVAAAAVAALETAGAGSMAPVAEVLRPAAAPPRPSAQRQKDEHPSAVRGDAQTPAAAPPRDVTATDGGADEDDVWHAPDEARLLVQSPRRLFLYWRFARDPRELLRAALGPVAERLGPAVRLVDEASGEEGAPAPAEGGDYWFDVPPGRLLRAEVGFHGEGLPFVRLISSNSVETPAGGVSRVADEAPEFRVAEQEFERVLEATGFAADDWRTEPAPRAARGDDPAQPSDPDQFDTRTRADDPPRPRASGDAARPASSPRDGSHFSSPRGGGHFADTRGAESNARGGGEVF